MKSAHFRASCSINALPALARGAENGEACVRGDAKAQLVQPIEAWGDGGKQAGALGIEEQAEGADEREVKMLGGLTGETVVEDYGGVRGFKGEGEDGGFAGAEMAGEGECGGADGAADFHPRQSAHVGQIATVFPPDLQFSHDGLGDDHTNDQAGQNLQMPELMEILER